MHRSSPVQCAQSPSRLIQYQIASAADKYRKKSTDQPIWTNGTNYE